MSSPHPLLRRIGPGVALLLAACQLPAGTRDSGPDATLGLEAGSSADHAFPDLPDSADASAALVPCPRAPCALRPIVYLHGFRGSNDDGVPLLQGLVNTDPRYDGYHLSGNLEHQGWPARSIGRREWLFALDYYLTKNSDGRGAYTAGPGRIGSNAGHACASPAGSGYLVSDSAAYDEGVEHDYSDDLQRFIASVRRATGATEIDVVAHSMGGMILRSTLSFHGGAARVHRALLLASPVKGISLVGFLAYFPAGQPGWMNAHEVAEIDSGSPLSKVRFSRCDGGEAPGAWGAGLLAHELAQPPATELHLMSGTLDLVTYDTAHHPLALTHEVVSGATHVGILKDEATLARVRELLGGSTDLP